MMGNKTLIFSKILLFVWVTEVCAGPGGISDMISHQVSDQVSRTVSAAIAKNLIERILLPQLKVRNESGEVKDFSVSADFRLFTLLHDDNTVRIWDAGQGIQRPVITSEGQQVTKVLSISNLNFTLLGKDNGVIDVYDIFTGKRIKQLTSLNEEIIFLSLSKDESLLAAAHENGEVVIWDLKTLVLEKTIKTPYDDDLKFIRLENNNQTFIAAGEDGFVDRWSIEKGEKIASLPQHADDISGLWVSTAYGSVASFDEDQVFHLSNANNPNQLNKEIEFDLKAVALSDDLKLLAVATESMDIKIFDATSVRELKQIKLNKEVFYLQFINHGEQLIAADKQGILHLFSVKSGQEIMKLISTDTGWTIVDNKGRFDSSEKGMVNVSWEAEEFEIPLDSFSDSYYEPGLLSSHLKDQQFINKKPLVVQQGIKLPPEVMIIVPDGNRIAAKPIIISVEAQGLGGGVEAVNFYHNGKIVAENAVIDSHQEVVDKLTKKTVEFNISPTVGKNTFKVIATNKMGIEGHSDEVVIDFVGVKQKVTLHVLTIGINRYKDPQLNLDYSVADAAEIANIFKKTQLAAYDEIVQHELRDNKATKDAILRQLKRSSQYTQNDIMIIYLAGHGLAVDGEWYYLPHETELKDNQKYFTQVGVSATEIKKILAQSKVQHFMVMVDACYSGAGLDAFRKMQYTQRHFSRGLSKSVGVVVLAATRQDQEAAELADLGHGLFTYVVSQGMGGKADLKPKNRVISAHEVADFSTKTIPIFSKKYLGASQEPTSFTMGSDFTLLKHQ